MAFAFWTVTISVALGVALAVFFLKPSPRPTLLAAAHGIAGSFGLALLALALRSPPGKAPAHGVAHFAGYAAILIAVAWVFGLVIAFLPLKTRRSLGVLIVLHGMIAVFAYVLLSAYMALA